MDDFQNLLNGLQEKITNLQNFQGTHNVSFEELFTDNIMLSKTKFQNIDNFLAALNVKTSKDFENLPQEDLDEFVNLNSKFSNWNEMYEYAVNNYIAKQTGFDFD